MPKSKLFLKESSSKKKSKHTPSAPTTADEYLAAGVDFEEAGEKWRGGDAAKSARFFGKAIDLYADALRKFPESFDLAYNKARVQYELTQHPKLLAQLPGTLVDLLGAALESSRVALRLKHDNADVLFNTAQCLTSLVEAVSSEISPEEGFKHLEEAIELFERCLTLQEFNYEESQAQMQAHPDDHDQDSEDATKSSSVEMDTEMDASEEEVQEETIAEDRWATIIEPVTADTLLDTLVALLETLTAFCNLLTSSQPPSPKTLSWLDELSSNLLNVKLPAYLSIPSDPIPDERRSEVFLTRATFLTALADATFRAGNIDIPTYTRTIEEAFSYETLSTEMVSNPEGLCNKAEALITFNQSIRLISETQNLTISDVQTIFTARWKALSTAITALTGASKIPGAENLVKIHLARGDVELLRFQLGQPSSKSSSEVYAPAAKNGATLLKNAGTYYRGAAGMARMDQVSWDEELKEAVVKETVAKELSGEGSRELKKLLKEEREITWRVLGDMRDEGLVGEGLVDGALG